MVATREKKAKCQAPKCRRTAAAGSQMCEQHTSEASNPVDSVDRISQIEALSWAKLDTEIRNHLQGAKILELEMEVAERNHREQQTARQNNRKQLLNAVEVKRREYINLVKEIAEKRGLDPEKITIDPDTRTIRDLRSEAPKR